MLTWRVSLVLAVPVLIVACRYSSSETPPPLEPDFERLAAEAASPSAQPSAEEPAAPRTDGGEAPRTRGATTPTAPPATELR
ncbi:MAG: hypothetical protein JW751_28100 [Polyangiaceae bacterium]|nr:hypothetical protein [Polyangiaceae bacterium]